MKMPKTIRTVRYTTVRYDTVRVRFKHRMHFCEFNKLHTTFDNPSLYTPSHLTSTSTIIMNGIRSNTCKCVNFTRLSSFDILHPSLILRNAYNTLDVNI